MKYKEFRSQKIFDSLENSDIDWIFCEVLKIKRSQLGQNIDISKKQQNILKKYAKKLQAGVPLAQVLGYAEFGGNKILVSRNVLAPRAETEELMALVKEQIKKTPNSKVLDLCTGSGAIALALADAGFVIASDISRKALKVARKNAKLNSKNIKFVASDMLNKIYGLFDVIVCNPPYIAWSDTRVDKNVHKYEPSLALYADDNGLKYYKILAQEAKYYLMPNGKIYLEVGIGQAEQVAKLFADYSKAEIKKDMQGISRFVIISK